MKKMLLVSMFQIVLPLLKSIEPNLKNKTITYIPTAYKVENLRFLFKLSKLGLEKQGLILDELDISSASYETIKSKLEKNDVIYVPGGNTFYLLQEMKDWARHELLKPQGLPPVTHFLHHLPLLPKCWDYRCVPLCLAS